MIEVKRGTFNRLSYLFYGEGREIAVILTYAALVGLSSLAIPIAVQAVVSSVAAASALQPVVVLTAFVGGVLAFSGIVRLLQIWVSELLQRRLMVRSSIALAHVLPQVSVRDFAQNYGADYVIRFMELFTIQKLTTLILLDGSAVFFQILVGLVLVSFYHPFFLAFALILIVCIAIIVFALGLGGIDTSHDESDAKYRVLGWLQGLARHPETFKSAQAERYAVKRTDELVTDYIERRRRHFSILMRQNAAGMLLQAITSALLLGLGSWLVIKGQLTLGQLVAAELVFGLVLNGVTKLGKHLESFYDLAASVKKVDSLFTLPVEKQAGTYFGIEQGGAELEIKELTVLSKGYAEPILEKISFRLAPGEKAVIWGSNGSGKSSLADVVFRSAQAYSGRVEVDGHPVNTIHPKELRSEIALSRGVELFPGTIEDNLLLGSTSVSSQALRRVLTLTGLADRIHSLKEGVNTVITSSSHPFSNGEALRLMVARQLLASPRLLVIDGTLDAMDEKSQNMILDVMQKDLPDLTVLVLTHEKSLARRLAISFELQGQKIVETSGVSHES